MEIDQNVPSESSTCFKATYSEPENKYSSIPIL